MELYKAIDVEVVHPDDDVDECILTIKIHEKLDVVEFFLDGEKIFSGDYTANFKEVFQKAAEAY